MPVKNFGYPVDIHPRAPEKGLINAVGDGNCGLRAAIQGLLIRGITTGKQAFVADFLQSIYDRQRNAVDSKGRNLFANNMTKVDNPVPAVNQQQNVQNLILAYRNMKPENLPRLRNDYFGTDNKEGVNANMDHVIYVLAGCLRMDISDYVNAKPLERLPFGGDDEGRADLRTFEKETDFTDTLAYFADHKIKTSLESSNPAVATTTLDSIITGLDNPNRFKQPELDISIYHSGGNHFETLVRADIDSITAAQKLTIARRPASPTSITSPDLFNESDPFANFEEQKSNLLTSILHNDPSLFNQSGEDFIHAFLEVAPFNSDIHQQTLSYLDDITMQATGAGKEYVRSLRNTINSFTLTVPSQMTSTDNGAVINPLHEKIISIPADDLKVKNKNIEPGFAIAFLAMIIAAKMMLEKNAAYIISAFIMAGALTVAARAKFSANVKPTSNTSSITADFRQKTQDIKTNGETKDTDISDKPPTNHKLTK